MAVNSTSDVLELLRRSALVDEQRLAEVLTTVEPSETAGASLLSSLVEKGLLTPWQSEQLRSGRSKGFYLGKYKILAKLGHGGMSHVYLAEHLEMGRRVAIKVLTGPLAKRPDYLERFRQEARAAALADHPNLVRAFDVGHEGSVHYLVMEYIEGSDLEKIVAEQGPLSFRQAADYIRQAATGLGFAHQAGLVHRDIKPANLLLDQKGIVKIVDLGLARLEEELETPLATATDDQLLGTVDYLAPEQSINSHNVTPQADLYSLGCTLYFLLTGQPPFPEGNLQQRVMMHRTKEPKRLNVLRPDVPEALAAICRRMMAKKPADRCANADEAVELLRAWLEGGSSRILSFLALQGTETAPTSLGSPEEDLTLAPIDEEAKTPSASRLTRPAPSAEDTNTTARRPDPTTINSPDLEPATEPVAKDANPLINDLLEELESTELPPIDPRNPRSSGPFANGPLASGPYKVPGRIPARYTEDAFPRWLLYVAGGALLFVVILLILVFTGAGRS